MATYTKEKDVETDQVEDPEARSAMSNVFSNTARWTAGFGGFSADVVVNINGTEESGTVTVKNAKEIGGTVVGCNGFDGGQLFELCDVKFHVQAPNGEYGLVEDIHMILDHIIYSYYVQKGL